MGNTRVHGDAASDVAGCVHQGSNIGNAVYLKMRDENPMSTGKTNAAALDGKGCDACSAKDREANRRKWMLQMGTIVLMGVSGLCLHLLIKPFATATAAASVKQYCQIEGKKYSIGSTARMANSDTGVCMAKNGVARWDLTSTAK